MDRSKENIIRMADSRVKSLQILANVCKDAYESGLTLEEVHYVSGAAWADYLDPREML